MLKCINIKNGLRIGTNGTYSGCCLMNDHYKEEDGTPIHIGTHSMEDALKSYSAFKINEAFENGEKHSVCKQCWDVEASGGRSKRIQDNRRASYVLDIEEHTPFQLEINLGNICNMACRMCNINASSQWKHEHNLTLIDKPKLSKVDISDLVKEHSIGFEDRGRIWDELKKNMQYVRYLDIYGGEPMLIKKQWEILEYCVEVGFAENQHVHFNTNGTIFEEKYIEILKHFRHVDISFSYDATDEQFDYIRHLGNWDKAKSTIIIWKEATKAYSNFYILIYSTIQILNILSYPNLKAFADEIDVPIHHNFLYHPERYNIKNIKQDYKKNVEKVLIEQQAPKEFIDYMNADEANDKHWEHFLITTERLDKSRNQNFSKTFPILKKAFNYETRSYNISSR